MLDTVSYHPIGKDTLAVCLCTWAVEVTADLVQVA